ncbi:MAG: DUF975 domain-containing protein [Snowella sp.]|nr:DUF975 domain-containing protein [Snowella sp.]
MANHFNPRPVSEPLSVGNVVSAGLRIYRDNFKIYYIEALKSYLWLIIPIYGWAKFAAIQGVIARLAFFEVMETPESLTDARRQVLPKLWRFLGLGILLFLIFVAFFAVFGILIALLLVGTVTNAQSNIGAALLLGLLSLAFMFIFLFAYIWLLSRLSFADLGIAIDNVKEITNAIGRSWKLTQGFVVKIQIIFFIAFLITLPFSAISNIGSVFLGDSNVGNLINLVLSILLGALAIPFWQSIKAVIYYDLLTRKEGLGLSLSDRAQ